MQITTTFSPGDKAWVFHNDRAQHLTIGKVNIEITDSPGVPGESRFSNYGPQNGRKEQYMCVETGVGSGSLYTLGERIFGTQEECEQANAERMAEIARENEERRARERTRILSQESYLREQLADIEKLKAQQPA